MRKCGLSVQWLSLAGVLSLVGCARGELGVWDDDAGESGTAGAGGDGTAGAAGQGGASASTGGAGGLGAGGSGVGGSSAGSSGQGAGVGGANGGNGGGGGASGAGGSIGGAGGNGGRDGGAGARPDGSAGSAGSSGAAGAGGAIVDARSEPPSACPTCSIKVQYECFQDGDMVHQIEFGATIVNMSDMPIALNTVTMRYWYTEDATGTQQPRCDGAMVGCSAVSLSVHAVTPARPGADAYVELAFTGGDMLAPQAATGEVRITILKTNPTTFTQSNDHSFRSTGAVYVDAPNITGYVGGQLAWGTEPASALPTP
jgi:hypothetical protein